MIQSFIPLWAALAIMLLFTVINCICSINSLPKARRNSRILLIEAVISYIILGVFLLTRHFEIFSDIRQLWGIPALGFGLFAPVATFRSLTLRCAAIRFQKYMETIQNGSTVSIENLAKSMGTNYRIVNREIRELIRIGYLRDIHLILKDTPANAPEPIPSSSDAETNAPHSCETQAPAKKVVQCKHCGASKIVTEDESTWVCDYCNMPLL